MSESAATTSDGLYVPKRRREAATSAAEKTAPAVGIVEVLTLNVRLKYSYEQLDRLVDELLAPSEYLTKFEGIPPLSILQQYALESTREPIDMSNQTERICYQPNLVIRKTDAFGSWSYNYLLDLLEVNYQCGDEGTNGFPPIWKTTSATKVKVNKIPFNTLSIKSSMPNVEQQENVSLLDLLKLIALHNKCDEKDARIWQDGLNAENIFTIQHLQAVAADNGCWDKLSSLRYFVKQMIRDHLYLNSSTTTTKTKKDPYADSKATLYGDIHRVRRYFHHVTKTLDNIAYLDQQAVDLSIEEIRRTYDDDGNVLSNIHNYLRTFCLKNSAFSSLQQKQQRDQWIDERLKLQARLEPLKIELQERRKKYSDLNKEVKTLEIRDENIALEIRTCPTNNNSKAKVLDLREQRESNQKRLQRQREARDLAEYMYIKSDKEVVECETKISELDCFLKLDLADEHRKLKVKFGRGLLLYGPPGTGKSELLKRAAVFAGITTTTSPLAAGELNRPLVGETEKLLVDIMNRSNPLSFLICAMIIDEIDGLVPKRDNNAQQSKVDGISVLLSHIEGVKNIDNLIVLGATNRRNMMDDAFLRRMQAKCFVGRPSPKIRTKMLQSLSVKDSSVFTKQEVDFLVRITTNFSGAAVGALKSSLIVACDQRRDSQTITRHTLLTLAEAAAREFSCWFGTGTLPSIFRLYPSLCSDEDQRRYSLEFTDGLPSGRILVNLHSSVRKCFIEMVDKDYSLEFPLDAQENSTLALISRFISGCGSRNIDTIQVIDLNFLTKNGAFQENQIFELLTTTFLECEEYNRSMLIFDIDSLIMLNLSDSNMSQSISISNIHLYQFIREKCKSAVVEKKPEDSKSIIVDQPKEHWRVIIVKHPFLRRVLVDDLDFKKSREEAEEERVQSEKEKEESTPKRCPKCRQIYIPAEAAPDRCRYHDGFIWDIQDKTKMKFEQAQAKLQRARLAATNAPTSQTVQMPKMIWACCLALFGTGDSPCQVDKCGLPEQLINEQSAGANKDDETRVQELFMNNVKAQKKLDMFLGSTTTRTDRR